MLAIKRASSCPIRAPLPGPPAGGEESPSLRKIVTTAKVQQQACYNHVVDNYASCSNYIPCVNIHLILYYVHILYTGPSTTITSLHPSHELYESKLSKDSLLYAEGLPCPYWRGRHQHAMVAIYLLAAAALWGRSETPTERLATVVFIATNCFAFGMSHLFHCYQWPPRAEILVEKWDHVAIFLNMAGNFTQLCLLSLDNHRVLLMGLGWTFALLAGAYVFIVKRKSLLHKALFAMVLLLALPELMYVMEPKELFLFAMTWLPCITGMVVYSLGWPDPVPGHFGYHEVMHAMISFGGIFSILFQYELLHNFKSDECIYSISDSMIDHLHLDLASVQRGVAKLFDKLLARFMNSIDRGQMI